MPVGDLKAQIARLPEQPGVYVFSCGDGSPLYVGKAASLRDRVRSYLGAWGTSPRIDALLTEAERLDTIVTDSVVEALALENNLIKQRQPRYNIRLRDDKNYPYLRLTVSEPFPRLLVARRVERDGDVYGGPFMPASLARRTMSLSHRLFGLRSCNEEITGRRGRPCLEYDIGRCAAPCVEEICTPAAYRRVVDRSRMLLEGQVDALGTQLEAEMQEAALDERFEQAAHLRDAVRTLRTLRDRQQKMASVRLGDRDAFGVKTGPSGSVIQVFQMRGGRVVERVDLVDEARGSDATADEAEVLQAALQQFYENREIPPEVHVQAPVPDTDVLEAYLSGQAGRRVEITVPRGQERRGLIDLATRNAAIAYQARFSGGAVANYDALDTLRALLGLPSFPRRIECFDISTLQGTDTVASMVVCEDGRMRKGEYRKYRVRGDALADAERRDSGLGIRDSEEPIPNPESPIPLPDDVAAMREVVFRRYRRVREQGGAMPDLVLIDGGKGQVSAAYEALERLGLTDLVAIGLAKKEELIVTRDRPDPVVLAAGHPSLLLLQQIRDEAHRFAVTFHRRTRTARRLRSELDLVRGIGPRRRRALLAAFGSVSGVRRASREALTAVVGAKAADAVLAHFVRSA